MSATVVALVGVAVLAMAVIVCHVAVAASYWWQMRDLRRRCAARRPVSTGIPMRELQWAGARN